MHLIRGPLEPTHRSVAPTEMRCIPYVDVGLKRASVDGPTRTTQLRMKVPRFFHPQGENDHYTCPNHRAGQGS